MAGSTVATRSGATRGPSAPVNRPSQVSASTLVPGEHPHTHGASEISAGYGVDPWPACGGVHQGTFKLPGFPS